jgi:hypothetical protein
LSIEIGHLAIAVHLDSKNYVKWVDCERRNARWQERLNGQRPKSDRGCRPIAKPLIQRDFFLVFGKSFQRLTFSRVTPLESYGRGRKASIPSSYVQNRRMDDKAARSVNRYDLAPLLAVWAAGLARSTWRGPQISMPHSHKFSFGIQSALVRKWVRSGKVDDIASWSGPIGVTVQ